MPDSGVGRSRQVGRRASGHAENRPVVEGEKLLGRFTVGERIGRGGYGTVHRAWDERLCRHVAIKAVEGVAAGRVLREAHAAARLNHPGIVTLYELGTEHGVTYLVSELVAGPNLREFAASGELTDRDLGEIGAELCAALTHAHAQGVIHRDLKPDNVLIRKGRGRRMRGSGERAMLADFGIAAVADEPSLTVTGQVVGTLAYMAPEQAAGEAAGPEADVYSLALTLYELWSGSNPVAAGTPAATAKRIGSDLPSLEEYRPELPPALIGTIDAALDSEPQLRPTLAELHDALESLAGSCTRRARCPSPSASPSRQRFRKRFPPAPSPCCSPRARSPPSAWRPAARSGAGRRGVVRAAALLLSRPREWLLPALAPLLGLFGLAAAFIVVAANHPRPGARPVLAALGWAWTAIAGAAFGRALGVTAAPAEGGWVGSGPEAIAAMLNPLLGSDALAAGLIWVGAAVLLGLILDAAGPALLALLGLVWAAGLVAALGAVGGPAAPSLLLTPALIAALGWIAYDRAGRPELRRHLQGLAALLPGAAPADSKPIEVRRARPVPRHPAGTPLDDRPARADAGSPSPRRRRSARGRNTGWVSIGRVAPGSAVLGPGCRSIPETREPPPSPGLPLDRRWEGADHHMSVLRNLESRIEGLVEGVFSRAFSSQVQPVEIARKLAKEMDAHRTASVSQVYVPNRYTVWLSPEDHERLRGTSAPSSQELSAYLLEHSRRRDYAMLTRPEVELKPDDRLRLGEFGIQTQMVKPAGPSRRRAVPGSPGPHDGLFGTAEAEDAEAEDRRATRWSKPVRSSRWATAATCSMGRSPCSADQKSAIASLTIRTSPAGTPSCGAMPPATGRSLTSAQPTA